MASSTGCEWITVDDLQCIKDEFDGESVICHCNGWRRWSQACSGGTIEESITRTSAIW